MNSVTKVGGLVLLLLGAATLAAGTRAQEPQDQPQEPQDNAQAPAQTLPKPAARGIPGIDDTSDNGDQTTNWQPDLTPVTGLEAPTIGQPELGHSYWIPGFIFASTIQSNPPGTANGSGWYANNYIGGELSLLENWSRSQLGLNYSGGGVITTQQNPETGENGWFQQFSIAQNINLNRWKIQWLDSFSYLPESQFGFGVGTGLALPGVNGITGTLGPGLPGLTLSLVPNQSIYSATGPRYSNTFGTQVTYLLSPRVSVTVAGAYQLLDYTQPGNVNSTSPIGIFGLNYALTKSDSIGVSYMFEAFHFDGEPQALSSQSAVFTYSKKVTKKVALSLFGGPQITSYRVPVGNQTSNVGAYAGASLTYAFERSSISASFFHGTNAGSGILVGADSSIASVAYSRKLGRVWTGTLNFGYSNNTSIATGVTTPAAAASTYNDLFGGGSISRPFGRNVQLSAAYNANHESTSGTCTGANCSLDFTQNVVTISLQFQTRPFVLP